MTHNGFLQLPLAVGFFPQNATGCKPISEEKVPVVAGVVSCDALMHVQDTQRSLRSLACRRLHFEKRFHR